MKKFYLLLVAILVLSLTLRFFNLSSHPPAPYWEEVALGYDAFSIFKTAKDHHGNFLPIVAFESFGDWKPSVYFYSIVPFIAIFDLSVLAVRLPSAFSGFFLTIFIGLIIKTIFINSSFKKIRINSITARNSLLLGTIIVAISPWAIQFSRAGWEVNLATFFITLSSFLILKLVEKTSQNKISQRLKYRYWIFIIIFLILASYTYHSTRIIAPMIGLAGFVMWSWSEYKKHHLHFLKTNIKLILFIIFFGLLLYSPILLNIKNKEVGQRFAQTSIFSDLSIIDSSNKLKENLNNNYLSRIIYHRHILFSQKIISNFFDHFNLDFLFLSGDINLRHNSGFTGQLYHFELFFLFFGIIGMVKNKNKYSLFIFYWLLIAIIPSSVTNLTPHALRILPAMPAFLIIITMGIIYFLDYLFSFKFFVKNKNLLFGFIIFCYIVEFLFFWKSYFSIYPKIASGEWQYGYQEMIADVKSLEDKNPQIPVYISRNIGRPAMYYWFFTKEDPQIVQDQETTTNKDQGEFIEFENIKFINSPSEINNKPAIIAITQSDKDFLSNENFKAFTQIKNLNNEIIWYVGIVE